MKRRKSPGNGARGSTPPLGRIPPALAGDDSIRSALIAASNISTITAEGVTYDGYAPCEAVHSCGDALVLRCAYRSTFAEYRLLCSIIGFLQCSHVELHHCHH